MANKTIAVLEGDGIGPEIMREGLKVLNAISKKYTHSFEIKYSNFGAQSYLQTGCAFPETTRKLVLDVDATLKGPIGLDSKGMDELQARGIKLENETVIALRGVLDTYAGYRPVILPASFAEFSPLKREVIGNGVDILMLRELTGGIYFGPKTEAVVKGEIVSKSAFDDCTYEVGQIERFANVCFAEAKKKNSGLVNIHKKNVLATSRLWNAVFNQVAKRNPEVKMREVLVDALAYELVVNPTQFNGVMALENMQGDIITDQAGGILGSLGLMPSACINPETNRGYFEPSHGSAPDIAGKGVANPYSMIGSVAFMLEKTLGMPEEARDIWNSLTGVFADGYRTRELVKDERKREALNLEGKILSTSQFGDQVVQRILNSRNI